MRYFRIEDSFDVFDRWYLRGPETSEGDEVDPRLFTEGREYEGQQPLRIPLRCGNEPIDFTLGAFEMPIVRKEIAERLHALAPGEIQRIPVRIMGDYGWFEIINVLTLRKAVNEGLSEITWWGKEDGLPHKVGKYAGIGKLVLDRERIQQARIFRLQDWEVALVVCEAIKDSLEKMNASGISFLELQAV